MNRSLYKSRLGPLIGMAGSLICLSWIHSRTFSHSLPTHGTSKYFVAFFCCHDLPILLSGVVSGALIERFARTHVLNDAPFFVNKIGTIIVATIFGLISFVIGLMLGLALGSWLGWYAEVLVENRGIAWRLASIAITMPISIFVITTLITLIGGAFGARSGRDLDRDVRRNFRLDAKGANSPCRGMLAGKLQRTGAECSGNCGLKTTPSSTTWWLSLERG